MKTQWTTILFAAVLTSLPLTLVNADPARPSPTAQLSLDGLIDECAGTELDRLTPSMPECIVEAITRKLQFQLESEAKTSLEILSQARPIQMAAAADRSLPAS